MKEVTTHYYCDYCDEEVTKVKHICIEGARRLGWVSPPNWVFPVNKVGGMTFQFCDDQCLGWFLKGDTLCQRKR